MLRIKDAEKFGKFQRFRPDDEFHERTKFSAGDLTDCIVTLLSTYDLEEDVWEFLVALQLANEGRHRAVRISVSEIPEGKSTVAIRSSERWQKALEIADWVDVQVASRVKQDAALQEACDKWGVTLRDAFRYLKQVRAWRATIYSGDFADKDWGDYIDGFEITPDGKLVTKG